MTNPFRWVVDWVDDHSLSLGLGGLLFLVLVAALSPRIFITIDAGHEGALFKRFAGGTDVEQAYEEGFHVIAPWNSMYIYDVRYQNLSEKFDAHTKDGLNLRVDVAFRFRVTRRNVPLLHKYIGQDYVAKLILPSLGARVREEVSLHTPEEVYSSKRQPIQDSIEKGMLRKFDPDAEADSLIQRVVFVELDEIFLRDVELPESLQRSMIEKNQQQQMAEEYKFRLEREEKERQRKVIEAQGIREFQDIVQDGITDRYLMWKGIDATLQLAQSPNSKIIVVGGGKTGLPILLGNLDASITPPSISESPAGGEGRALTPLTNTPQPSSGAKRTATQPSMPPTPPPAGTSFDSGKTGSQLAPSPATNAPAPDNGAQSEPGKPQATPR